MRGDEPARGGLIVSIHSGGGVIRSGCGGVARSGVFGSVTVRTPFLSVALIRATSTSGSMLIERSKRPVQRVL